MKKTSKHTCFRFALLLITFLVILIITSCDGCDGCSGCDGCGGRSSLEPGEVSVKIKDDDQLVINAAFSEDMANLYSGKKLYLFELAPGENMSSLNSMKPIDEIEMSKDVNFTLSFDNNGAPRVCSGFVTAFYDSSKNQYSPTVERPVYISNPEKIANNTDKAVNYSSIKGIYDPGLTHAIALGISHTVVDIPIENYLIAAGDENAVCHIFGGQSYYFNTDAVKELDEKLSGYKSLGVNVFLRVYLGRAGEVLGELSFLAYPEAEEGGEYYGINFSDPLAINSYCAFVDLLADRYCDGEATSLIVGRGANSPECDADSAYVESYELALRFSHNIMRSHCSNATVYAAVDESLKSAKAVAGKSASEFMLELADIAKEGGDYNYGISAEMVAISDRVWYGNPNTELLIPTDIDALTNDVASRDELLFDGKVRSIIITDFSISSDPQSEASVLNQAASYAYTYYKTVDNGEIDALIYSSVDGGVGEGLVNAESGEKNKIYSIFSAVDTEKSIGQAVAEIIEDMSWTDLYQNKDLRDEVTCGKLISGSVKFGSVKEYECSLMFTADGDSFKKFEAVGGYVGMKREGGYSSVYAEFSENAEDASVIMKNIPSEKLSGNYLLVPMKIESEIDQTYGFTLILTQKDPSGDSVTYTAKGSIPSGKKQTAVFDISDFTSERLERDVTVMLIPDGEQACDFTVLLDAFYSGNEPPDVFLTVMIIVGCSLLGVALIVLFVVWFRKNYKPKTDEKKETEKENDKPMPTVSQVKKQQTSQRTAQGTAQQTAQRKAQTSKFDSEK